MSINEKKSDKPEKSEKAKKTEKAPMTKKKLITIIVIAVAAALLVCAAIIIPIALLGGGENEGGGEGELPYTLDGTYRMSVSIDSFESGSTLVFSENTIVNTYYGDSEEITVNYTYAIEKTDSGRVIKMKNTETKETARYSFSEVTENGALTAIIINGVWYVKQ